VNSEIRALSLSPDEKRMLVVSVNGSIAIYDVATGRLGPIVSRAHDNQVVDVAWSRRDATRAVTASFDTTVRLWNVAGDEPKVPDPMPGKPWGPVVSIAVAPDAKHALAGTEDRSSPLLELDLSANTAMLVDMVGLDEPVRAATYVPDTHYAFYGLGATLMRR